MVYFSVQQSRVSQASEAVQHQNLPNLLFFRLTKESLPLLDIYNRVHYQHDQLNVS